MIYFLINPCSWVKLKTDFRFTSSIFRGVGAEKVAPHLPDRMLWNVIRRSEIGVPLGRPPATGLEKEGKAGEKEEDGFIKMGRDSVADPQQQGWKRKEKLEKKKRTGSLKWAGAV